MSASPYRPRVPAALALLVVLAAAPPRAAAAEEPRPALEITYVGNEGFLIAAGEVKVLVDALYREGVRGYRVHPPGLRSRLESAQPPFDGVDLVLASHFHADHFDAGAVAAHLKAAPGSLFVSTEQAVERLKAESGWTAVGDRVRGIFPAEGDRLTITHAGATVTAINLHHGRDRPIQNLGLLIEVGGWKIFHAGDTVAGREDLAKHDLAKETIDVALLPYWLVLSERSRAAIRAAVRPGTVVPIHIPAQDAPESWFEGPGGVEGLARRLREAWPGAVVYTDPMESRTFPAGAPGGG